MHDEKRLYEEMLYDLFGRDRPNYNSMACFVHKLLSPLVINWCVNTPLLRGGEHENDIMQLIQIRIYQKSERYFFKPVDGKTDKTCDEFKAWSRTVAKRCFLNYLESQKTKSEKNVQGTEYLPEGYISSDDGDTEENRESLNMCFNKVLSLKSKPHIVLSWMAISLFVILFDPNKIKATHSVVKICSKQTLSEMFEMILIMANKVKWLSFDQQKVTDFEKKLSVVDKTSGETFGEMKFEQFYMKKGPESSISDWYNKVSKSLKKQ